MRPADFRAVVLASVAVVTARLAARWAGAYRRGAAARRASLAGGGSGAARRPSEQLPSVTVIVPAWQERGTIERCLGALAAVDYPDWEAVIVAGGSDGTHAAAEELAGRLPRARVIAQGPAGKPAALNAGLAASTKDIVVVLDADGVVQPDWLRGLVAPLAGAVKATTGDFVPLRSTAVSRTEQMERIAVYRTRRAPFLQGSGSIAIDRTTLVGLGGFRRDAYADDWVLDAQLRAAGVPVAFAPGAMQSTERPATIREFWDNQLRWRRAHLRSIGQVPAHFLRDLPTTARTVDPYLVAWSLLGLGALGIAATVGGRRTLGSLAGTSLALGLGWSALAPLATVIEAMAFTRDLAWARDVLAPPALALVDLAAAIVASATLDRATLRFKGPRATAATTVPAAR